MSLKCRTHTNKKNIRFCFVTYETQRISEFFEFITICLQPHISILRNCKVSFVKCVEKWHFCQTFAISIYEKSSPASVVHLWTLEVILTETCTFQMHTAVRITIDTNTFVNVVTVLFFFWQVWSEFVRLFKLKNWNWVVK